MDDANQTVVDAGVSLTSEAAAASATAEASATTATAATTASSKSAAASTASKAHSCSIPRFVSKNPKVLLSRMIYQCNEK